MPAENKEKKEKKVPKRFPRGPAQIKKKKTFRQRERAPKEYTLAETVNLARILRNTNTQLIYRAPRAIRAIKRFVRKRMQTTDVTIDVELNKFIWNRGIKNPPRKVRLIMTRKLKDDAENVKGNKYHTVVSHVLVPSFNKLQTQRIESTENL